ncbi:MAG: hypothetical protein PWP31_1753 [Clostridia bacterium]|nr:hypothetical protein [Clostridia bacterium]
MSKFYGIGAGPGDSSLLTIKAVETLKKLDIIYTPKAKKSRKSLALTIVEEYLKKDLEIKQRHFPMNFNIKEKNQIWDDIAQEIVDDVKKGKNVGFITLGDPMIYSTYEYLLTRIKNKVKVETIPGITSFTNIASNQNFPLVMDKETLVVVPCTTDEEKIDFVLQNYNSIVLMKVYKNFKTIIEKIKKYGLTKYSILVSNSSLNEEKVFRNIENVNSDQISYFSTILINKKQEIV